MRGLLYASNLAVPVPSDLRDCVTFKKNFVSFDLRRMILRQLRQAGIENILFPMGGYHYECTCCTLNEDKPKYFSHFGFREKSFGHDICGEGRNALFVEMKKE